MAGRLTRALIGAVAGGIGALFVVVVITLIRGGSISKAIGGPDLWIVEGVTVAVVFIGAFFWPEDRGSETAKASPMVDVLFTAGFAAAAAIIIGVLIAISLDESIIDILTNQRFLIVSGIGVAGAALSAWSGD